MSIQKQRVNSKHFLYEIAFKYQHILLPLLLIFVAYVIIMPRKWHYFTLTYTFGILNGLLIAFALFFGLVKLELIDLSNLLQILKILPNTGNDLKNRKAPETLSESALNEQIHSLLIQSAIFKQNKSFDGVYKGWMNELREIYSPDNYFLNKTRSVYINLDGAMLRLQTTNSKVPKRAMCNEKIVCTFNKFRMYDISGCQVQVLPAELCRKRYWSKKYPLALSGVKLVASSSSQYKSVQTPRDR